MTEALVLPATIIDGFSKPLKALVSRLRDVKVPDGMKQVGKQMESLRKEAEGVGKAVTNGLGGLTSGLGLGAIGAGAFTAAGALTAVGTAVRSFADNAVRMRKFSHETGIAVTTLQKMQQVSDGLAIDPDAIASGLSFAARNADAMRLHQGNFGALAGLRGGKSIADDLANTKSNDEVVQKELNYLAMQKNAQQRRTLSGLFFGTEEFAEFGANGIESLKKRMAEAGKNTYVPSEEDTKKAEAFQDAISHLSATFENLKNSIGGELAPDITAAADAFKEFAGAHAGDVKEFFHDVVTSVEAVDWAGTAKNFHDLFSDIKSIADWASGLKNPFGDIGESSGGVVKGSPADKLLQWWKSGSGKSGSDQDVPFWAPLPGAKKSSFDGSGAGIHPAAYHPGMQAALIGASTARDSEAVAILAKGVELGMIAFTQSYLGGGAGSGAGGDGFQNASWGGGGSYGGGGKRAVLGGGGSGGTISAESIRAVHAKGSLAKNQREAYDALIAGGLSHDAAMASVANFSGEALNKPGDVHWDGKHYAHGIAQWDDVRSQRIKDQFGKFPQQMSVTDQVKAYLWEAKKYYANVWKKLNSGDSPESMVDTLVRKYEIPGNPNRAISQRLGFLRGLPDNLGAPERKSTARASGAVRSTESVKPPTGKLDIHVHSKDHPVTVKQSDSDLFQGLKIDRGKSVSL